MAIGAYGATEAKEFRAMHNRMFSNFWRADSMRHTFALALAVGCLLAETVHAQWTVTNLHPAGATESRAYAVSEGRQAGYATFGMQHAIVWNGAATSWVDLNPVGATSSVAIASSGNLNVGTAILAGGAPHAGMWSDTASSWIDLNPTGSSGSHATGISGTQQVGDAFGRPALWQGTPESWVEFPSGIQMGQLLGTSGFAQVGFAAVNANPFVAHASLWTGSPVSWVDLNPSSSVYSVATAISGTQQVGYTLSPGGYESASLWTGSASSWVRLSPEFADPCQALGTDGNHQVGYVGILVFHSNDDYYTTIHASMWSGTAASWEDLSRWLPGSWGDSYAHGVCSDGINVFVAGHGFNNATGREEALLWTRPVCPGDFNQSGGLNAQDIFDFLNAWLSADPRADFNGNGLSVQDIFDFLNAWFAGC